MKLPDVTGEFLQKETIALRSLTLTIAIQPISIGSSAVVAARVHKKFTITVTSKCTRDEQKR